MSGAATKLRAVDDPVAEARVRLERASRATAKALKELESARAAAAGAHAAFVRDPSKRDAKRTATEDAEAAETRYMDRVEEGHHARAAVEAEELSADLARFDALINKANGWINALVPAARRIDAARRELAAAQDSAADVIVDSQEAFDAAADLAERRSMTAELAARATRATLGEAKSLLAVRSSRTPFASEIANGWGDAFERPERGDRDRPAWDSLAALLDDSALMEGTTK